MGLEWQPVFLGQRARETLRLERAHLDQHVGQLLPGFLALARLVEILCRDPRAVEQDCLETLARGRHQVSPGANSPADARTRRFRSYRVIFNDNDTPPNIPPLPPSRVN